MTHTIHLITVVASWNLLTYSSGARILAFLPMPWRSHQFVFHQLVRSIASKGHEVDFYTPIAMTDPPPGVNSILVKDRLMDGAEVIDDEEFMNASPYGSLEIVYDVHMHLLNKMYTEEKVYSELLQSKKKYDLVITEFPLSTEYSAYFAHKFKAPLVAVMGYFDHPWTNEIAGLPDNPSYMISYTAKTNDKMNYWERLNNFYRTASIIVKCYWETSTRQQAFADKYMKYEGWENRPPLTEMIANVDLILVNTHISMGYPFPKASHVKEIGGIHVTPTKPLPKDLKEFMDDAPHGVIYFSLGSLVDAGEMLKDGKFENFVNVFKKLKQKILWKVVSGFPKLSAPNILTKEWFPQQDILAHNNTVLFITHGGLQSMVETINYGIPTIGMPVFFDQFKDVKFMETVGMGLPLHFSNISEKSIEWSINEVLFNPRYREQAKKRQELFRDRSMSPADEAVFWIEYVLKHGNVLQPVTAQMKFYQVYMLDILATVVALALVLIFLTAKMFRIVSNAMFSVASSIVDSKKKLH